MLRSDTEQIRSVALSAPEIRTGKAEKIRWRGLLSRPHSSPPAPSVCLKRLCERSAEDETQVFSLPYDIKTETEHDIDNMCGGAYCRVDVSPKEYLVPHPELTANIDKSCSPCSWKWQKYSLFHEDPRQPNCCNNEHVEFPSQQSTVYSNQCKEISPDNCSAAYGGGLIRASSIFSNSISLCKQRKKVQSDRLVLEDVERSERLHDVHVSYPSNSITLPFSCSRQNVEMVGVGQFQVKHALGSIHDFPPVNVLVEDDGTRISPWKLDAAHQYRPHPAASSQSVSPPCCLSTHRTEPSRTTSAYQTFQPVANKLHPPCDSPHHSRDVNCSSDEEIDNGEHTVTVSSALYGLHVSMSSMYPADDSLQCQQCDVPKISTKDTLRGFLPTSSANTMMTHDGDMELARTYNEEQGCIVTVFVVGGQISEHGCVHRRQQLSVWRCQLLL